LIKGPEQNFNFNYDKERSSSTGAFVKSPESKRAYLCLKSTNDRIYALYSGREKQNPSNYSNSNRLYSFDWNGNPRIKYVLDCDISSFDVDAEDKVIFAIRESDKSIISFSL
jgi:hypothetical protein